MVPGAVKALRRYTFMEKYGGRFDLCKDLIRATIEVNSLAEVADVVEAIYQSSNIIVVREKNRFDPEYDALPIGGYRDFQLLVLFQVEDGVWRWGEVQVRCGTAKPCCGGVAHTGGCFWRLAGQPGDHGRDQEAGRRRS